MHNSDFLRTADRTKRDVAQGYADDETHGGLIPVPEELNKYTFHCSMKQFFMFFSNIWKCQF